MRRLPLLAGVAAATAVASLFANDYQIYVLRAVPS